MPVLDGFTLNRVVGRSPRGGDWLDEQVAAWLAGKQLSVAVSVGGKDKDGKGVAAPASYGAFQERRLVRDIKESCCMVPQPATEDGAAMDLATAAEEPCYELPDGTKVMAEPALVKIPGECVRACFVGLPLVVDGRCGMGEVGMLLLTDT